ncbi:MAG: 2-dehydropantoate 2-reductase [Pseudomonadota bacterium]|nr:2-dehydropantoate 2-reductase [Pseudomonadota bacterium]
MNVCIVGAGAIGGFLAVKLALAGAKVTAIMRGANLAAVKANGLTLIEEENEHHVRDVVATDNLAEVGPHDLVILAMKANQVTPVAKQLAPLLRADTPVVTMQNGIPWWYFQKHGGEFDGRCIESVDPGGVIAEAIAVDRVIGCVVYPACEIVAPGVIRHIEGNRFPVGELDGAETSRVAAIASLFKKAGLKSPVLTDIRSEIWLKLWGNLTFNPISALTHATLVDICRFPPTRALAVSLMTEAQTIANRLGIEFRVTLERRIAGAEAVGKHKTSMLQDVEAGRMLEIDALVGSVIELGRLTQTPTPHIDAVYACASLLANMLRESGGRLTLTQ